MGSVWMHYFEVVQFACRQQMYMAAAPVVPEVGRGFISDGEQGKGDHIRSKDADGDGG
jgi:hypothetical protein